MSIEYSRIAESIQGSRILHGYRTETTCTGLNINVKPSYLPMYLFIYHNLVTFKFIQHTTLSFL